MRRREGALIGHAWNDILTDGSRDAHIVQFYESAEFLEGAVSCWLRTALERDGAALLACTPAHRDAVAVRLRAAGLDPDALAAQGRFAWFDADALMQRFMRGPLPDPQAFHAALDAAIAPLRASGATEVRAWGEMVNLLWKRGNLPAAMRLEELWNESIARHGLRLLCSYEAHGLDPQTFELLPQLTHGHGLLIPTDDFARLDAAVARAVVEVCGEDAGAIANAVGTRGAPPLEMPASVAMLAALRRMVPYFGDQVILRARAHYEGSIAPAGGLDPFSPPGSAMDGGNR